MDDQKKALIVGLVSGALPFVINVLNTSAGEMFKDFDATTFIGSSVQMVFLMLLGGFFVYINKETNLFKAFQLSLAAPAIVVGALNGQALTSSESDLDKLTQKGTTAQTAPPELESSSHTESFNLLNFVFPAAHAADSSQGNYLKGISTKDKFLYGLTGNLDNPWFVIVGSHIKRADAEKQVQDLKAKGYKAKVFEKFMGSEYYGVVIGSYLSIDEANKLKQQAIKDGLPKDTYLWKWR